MTHCRTTRLGALLAILLVSGCGTSRRDSFHADVLAPRPIEPSEQKELRSLGRLVHASSTAHSLLLFVPATELRSLESLVREAVAQVPGATAILDADVEFGSTNLGPIALVYFNRYIRVSGTAAGPATETSR